MAAAYEVGDLSRLLFGGAREASESESEADAPQKLPAVSPALTRAQRKRKPAPDTIGGAGTATDVDAKAATPKRAKKVTPSKKSKKQKKEDAKLEKRKKKQEQDDNDDDDDDDEMDDEEEEDAEAEAEAEAEAKAKAKAKAADSLFTTANNDTSARRDADADAAVVAQARKRRRSPAEQAAERKVSEQAKNERTLFVGNVPCAASTNLKKLRERLKKAFVEASFGEVESLRIRSVPIAKTKIAADGDYKMMNRVSVFQNKLADEAKTCHAYVVFTSASAVGTAIKEGNGMDFDGHHLRLDRAVNDKGKAPVFDADTSVFLGNIASSATDEDLWAHFSELDGVEVRNVRLVRDRATNKPKGIAYVLFAEAGMVGRALRQNGKELLGRELRVSRCKAHATGARQRIKKGFEQRSRKPGKGGKPGKGDKAPSRGEARAGGTLLDFQGARSEYTGAVAARRRMQKNTSAKPHGGSSSKRKMAKK